MNNNVIQHPKVVVIGAGSLFFGRQAIWQMVHSPYLNKGTLSLVDTDENRLKKLLKLAKMVAEAENTGLVVEGSTDRRDVLGDADFVILSFARDTVKYRSIDCAVSEKYGIRMCSGDTIGPGGIFRSMRELPVILECAADVQSMCPDAWVINYINPTTVNGIGISRKFPSLKTFALCDGLHMPYLKRNFALRANIVGSEEEYTEDISAKFDLRIAGVNHFGWIVKAEYDGRDVVPEIVEKLRIEAATETNGGDTGAKAIYNSEIGYELYKVFGYIPANVSHTKEYVRYWQGHGRTLEKIPPLSIWESEPRYMAHEGMWREIDGYVSGETPIGDYMKNYGSDHATDIVESMVGNLGKTFYVNTFNIGAVTNMNDDAFLELHSEITMDGIKPLPVGEMPKGIHGLQELVLDTHELTAEAVIECNFKKLRRAMMTDPLMNSIGDADNVIKELLEQEKDILPRCWYE